MSKATERDEQVIRSSGNVFADLGLPSAPEDMLKVDIARAIAGTIRKRNLTQAAAGKIIGGVCHGPIFLANVKAPDGSYVVRD